MKIIQLLLDGYNKSNDYPKLYDSDILTGDYLVKSVDTKLPGIGRLGSPKMWGRTLYGSLFPDSQGYNCRKSDKWNAEHQGYSDSLDQSEWIWNKLPDNVTKFIVPYYLVHEIINPELVSSLNTTLITRNYSDQLIRIVTKDRIRVEKTLRTNHMICDLFDHNKMSDELVSTTKSMWSMCDPYIINEVIESVYEEVGDIIKSYINDNFYLLNNLPYPDISDNMYIFIGTTDSDALYHYCKPYKDIFELFRERVNQLLRFLVNKYDPDIIIIHGDHDMRGVETMHFRSRHISDYTYKGYTDKCFEPLDSKFPMYCDHGRVVGGEIYYKDPSIINKFEIRSNELLMDSIRRYLINCAY